MQTKKVSDVAACREWRLREGKGRGVLEELPRWKFFSPTPLTLPQIESLTLCFDSDTLVQHSWDQPGANTSPPPLFS